MGLWVSGASIFFFFLFFPPSLHEDAHVHIVGEGRVFISFLIVHKAFESFRLILMGNRKSPQMTKQIALL